MPKEYFSIPGSSSLGSIPKGSHIHITGVCGVAMAQLAVLLANQGFRVTGSDREFFEPMGSFLRRSAIQLFDGYQETNILDTCALVVIGNSIRYENPEVVVVENRKIPYTFFPKILSEAVIRESHSLVIAGTHGKSTTTSLAATSLQKLGAEPGYFIGAEVYELPTSLNAGRGDYCVTEGDEYDSAFFAKTPKFHFYHPNTLIFTSLEFDHADIYASLEDIENEFEKLIGSMKSSDTCIACIDDSNVARLIERMKREATCGFITYGQGPGAEIRILERNQDQDVQHVTIQSSIDGIKKFSLPLTGEYNAKNATAVLTALCRMGFDSKDTANALKSFQGLRRRQEVIFNQKGITVIEDFAHHPTAVRETLAGIREKYPKERIWAVFEPRSNTSRRKVFEKEYVRSFGTVDQVLLCEVARREIDAGIDLLDVGELAQEMNAQVPTRALPDAAQIASVLLQETQEGDVVVLMSNGSFGGLPKMLVEKLG